MNQNTPWISFLSCALRVAGRRLLNKPTHPAWTWTFETVTEFVRQQGIYRDSLPDIAAQRAWSDQLSPPKGMNPVQITPLQAGTANARWFIPHTPTDPGVLLYFPGGGYVFNNRSNAGLISNITTAAHCRTLTVDYRLAPEAPYPAALEDALSAYEWLLAQGTAPGTIVVGGDSAGGGLSILLLLALRARGLPMPSRCILLSPWVDLSGSGSSMQTNARFDIITPAQLNTWAGLFAAGLDLHSPQVSPLYADLEGLPPLYIQAGDSEILIDQIRDFASRAHHAGVSVRLNTWNGMNHDFQVFGSYSRPSREALARIADIFQK